MCLDKNWKVSAKTKANTIELVKYLLKLYPNAKIVRHHDASGKICPRSMSGNNWEEWNEFYKQLTGVPVVSVKGVISTPNTHKVAKNDTLWGLSKQYNATVNELKEWNNLKTDTIAIGEVLTLKKSVAKPFAKPKPVAKKDKFNLPNTVYRVTKPMQRGSGIMQVQLALSSIYFYPNKGAKNNGCDGWYGNDTANAVKRFQSVRGLKPDGIYGPKTANKLASIVNK